MDLSIIKAVHQSNKDRIKKIVNKIINNTNKNQLLTLLGLSFKPNTDDIRDSTSIKIAMSLKEHHGYTINCYDPAAMDNAKENIDMNYFESSLMLVKSLMQL